MPSAASAIRPANCRNAISDLAESVRMCDGRSTAADAPRLVGACSTITWAFVPPNPNELTPAMRFPAGHGVGSVTTRIGSLSQEIIGLGCRKCRFGGITPRSIDRITLIRPHTPAAHSRWPQLVLTEPTRSGEDLPANT